MPVGEWREDHAFALHGVPRFALTTDWANPRRHDRHDLHVGGRLRALILHTNLISRLTADLNQSFEVDDFKHQRRESFDDYLFIGAIFKSLLRPSWRSAKSVHRFDRQGDELDRAALVGWQFGQTPMHAV